MTADLIARFVAALRLPADDHGRRDAAAAVARGVLDRWSEPHRHHHDMRHLTATLAALELLWADRSDAPRPGGLPVRNEPDRDDLILAVWYHDAVYEGRAGADEEASARLAETELGGLRLAPGRVAEVARLVRLTAGHAPSDDDLGGQLVCDADLSVLGAPVPVYLAYARAVRAEHARVPDDAFRAGRAAVLSRLAAAPFLYRTPAARRRWEATARANLAAELARLAGPTARQEAPGPP